MNEPFVSGDVVLASVRFTDSLEFKKRPALVLFEEHRNVIVAGITSNLDMDGIKISKREGLPKDSIIKLNYIFTISKNEVSKKLFHLESSEKKEVHEGLT